MRTLEQIYYTEPLIELGSFQYSNIEKSYELYTLGQKDLPVFFKNILDNHKDELVDEVSKYLSTIYNKFEAIRIKEVHELDREQREEFYFESKLDHEAFKYIHEVLHESAFEFPVKASIPKLALLEYVQYTKNRAWDLWTLCQDLRINIFRNMMPDVGESMALSAQDDAALIYTLKVVFDLDDTTVEKYFGGFDT